MSQLKEKSEILFLYESTYSIPNGDPFTGEQRFDEETKKILVSDVRIKRFIRDYLSEIGETIFVINDKTQIEAGSKESGASARMKGLRAKFGADEDVKKAAKGEAALRLLQKCIDVRLFGGISTEEKEAVNITGAVQFAMLNPSLNASELRIHQNTSLFSSSADKTRGSIGTTTVVPYALCQIHGWVNPYNATASGLKNEDIDEMFKALWNSINNVNTRSKSNQNSVLLIQIVYGEKNQKLYGADRFIKLRSDKLDEQIRSMADYSLDFAGLDLAASSDKVAEIRYYTEIEVIEKQIKDLNNSKVKKMTLFS